MTEETKDNQVNNAVAEGGAYNVIRQRLEQQTVQLKTKTDDLNESRMLEFGKTEFIVKGRARVRTENVCIPRDMIQVNEQLVFGYNIKIGMKSTVEISDVLGIYEKSELEDGTVELNQVPYEDTFLGDVEFRKQFHELYRFYKNSQLVQLKVAKGFILAAFKIGAKETDVRVFRWSIDTANGSIKYVDDRGEDFIKPPSAHDFSWSETSREDHVTGEHPHVSILDKVFVECVGGDLTIKIENSTTCGKGIYNEPVDDQNQSLSDAKIHYADLGNLILLKVLPYREEKTRYFVFNTITKTATRIDAIEHSCVQLPEGHGLIFPGGYYLVNGETKTVDGDNTGMKFKRSIKSPNGEDVLYKFYRESDGLYSILSYNIINKKIQTPIMAHGYSIFANGDLILFKATEGEEAQRTHSTQIWKTPFVSEEFLENQEVKEPTFLGKLGNSEIVRAISDLFAISGDIRKLEPSIEVYEHLISEITNVLDSYYWLEDAQVGSISDNLHQIKETSELVLDEFEKVIAIKAKSESALADAKVDTKKTLNLIKINQRRNADDYVEDLHTLRKTRGHLVTVKDMRHMDVEAIEELIVSIDELESEVNTKLSKFLQDEKAFSPYKEQLDVILSKLAETTKVVDVDPLVEKVETVSSSLDLINEVISNLDVEDTTIVTDILENVSALYSKLNQVRAKVTNQRKEFLRQEKTGQFGSQFKLFSQNINNAISVSTTPEKCDEESTKIYNQLEELEGEYAEFEDYLSKIIDKREEVQETFESHKQKLLNDIRKRCDNIYKAADRTLESVSRKIESFDSVDELNTYLSSDNLVIKAQKLIEDLRVQNDTMRADNLLSKFKSIKDQSVRVLRDKSEIYEDGGRIMKIGKHKFPVHQGTPELSVIQQDKDMMLHITGTEYFEKVDNDELYSLYNYWDNSLISESSEVSRAEYLAGIFLDAVASGDLDLSIEKAITLSPEELLAEVSKFAGPRYQESYDKGVHDHDAAIILSKSISIYKDMGFLRFDSQTRAKSMLLTLVIDKLGLKNEINIALNIEKTTGNSDILNKLVSNVAKKIGAEELLPVEVAIRLSDSKEWIVTQEAYNLFEDLSKYLDKNNYAEMIESMKSSISEISSQEKANLFINEFNEYQKPILTALALSLNEKVNLSVAEEAVSILLTSINKSNDISLQPASVKMSFDAEGLLSEHKNIESGKIQLFIDDWTSRVAHQKDIVGPAIQRISKLKSEINESAKDNLNMNDFKANPLTSFVRNRLIMESYFPIIGDNLAKQMGSVGDNKRTDLMGMLLLISPPGYGKTTLIEYMANKLGLIFMKINCPSLGHEVVSLDPSQAPNSTAKKELEKLNLALEMGNNVMLYLDDIQHTDPEFLQKFISLCDGTRKIEGVWKGKTKTYDMRGKRFSVVMAGNPYTESGDTFTIPDMLANRADIYNLGDMLSGSEEVFASSYIENALTSNQVLAPMATRSLQDVYRFIKKAEGEDISSSEFDYDYSAAESDEIISILQKLFLVRDVVMKANAAYVESAATADEFRKKPAFKLQGSYRNMAKMAEKIMSVMTEDEIKTLVIDHYQGESQTLTTGAEENMLHLKEIIGALTEEETVRWNEMLEQFNKGQAMGGKDADSLSKVAHTISDIKENLAELVNVIADNGDNSEQVNSLKDVIEELKQIKTEVNPNINVEVSNSTEEITEAVSKIGELIIAQEETRSESNNGSEKGSNEMDKVLKQFNRTIARFERSIEPLIKTTSKNNVVLFNLWQRLDGLTEKVVLESAKDLNN